METLKERTVADIVTGNYKTADVFKKYGIDFCCGGQVSLTEICDKQNIDISKLEHELDDISVIMTPTNNFDGWELDFLIDYITSAHHNYVTENIPRIKEYANKVANVHGPRHKEVIEIKELFDELADELLSHMHKEEKILFPFIRALVETQNENDSVRKFPLNMIRNPIGMMETEHESAGQILKRISQLSSNFTPPPEACNTFIVLYSKLKEFEEDLHKHIHLENNILFPKALRMAEKIVETS